MIEFQQDQRVKINYKFVNDNGEPVNVDSIAVTSSNDASFTVEEIPQTETGTYSYYLNWAGVGVGELSMSANRLPEDQNPITDLVAVSTIPDVAEGVTRDFSVEELT